MATALRGEAARTDDGAESVVRAYLAALEARDLARARGMLARGFEMRFPGTGPMRDLGELVEWAKGRYRRIGKTIEAVEIVPGPRAVVWMRGRLHGEWPDGRRFDGIRFVDRFELADGLIVRQDVWNDLAEMRPPQHGASAGAGETTA